MTWQLLIWNVFVWSLTGVLIYATSSSLWWLLIPCLLTMINDAAEVIRATKDEDDYEVDDATRKKMQEFIEKAKRSNNRSEWL